MKNLKIKLVFLFMFSPIFCIATDSSILKQWNLEIILEKDIYLHREPIWLDIVLTNISSDTLRFWSLYPRFGLNITLTDSIGDTIPYSGPEFDYVMKEGLLVYPGEKIYDAINLIDIFAILYVQNIEFLALPPGKYNVKASYGNAVISKIDFRVAEPIGAEKEVEQLLLDAFRYSFRKPRDSVIAALREVIEVYPTSVYAELPARHVLSVSEFLEKYPNSGYTKTNLEDNTRNLNTDIKKEYLESAMKKYQGTRAARHAEQLLKLLGK